MTTIESIGEQLKYEDNGFSCRRAEEIIQIKFVGTEIVRCKDCKHYLTLKGLTNPNACTKGVLFAKPEDFCSRGERKEVNPTAQIFKDMQNVGREFKGVDGYEE